MAQHVHADGLHVLRRHIAAALEERIRFRRNRQIDRRARRRAVLDEAGDIDVVRLRLARGEDQIHDVVLDLLVHVDGIDHLARLQDLLGRDHGLRDDLFARLGHAIHDLALFLFARVLDRKLEHEPVDLRFGQRIRAFLLDRVLRRQHEERLRAA